MLEFFRKYQKFFFLVIAVVVISSFVFFGTFNAMGNGPVRQDRVVGVAIDGSKMNLNELQDLSRFIAVDREDVASAGPNTPPNLLNDGVVRKDLLRTGVAEVLVRGGWDLLKSGFGEKLDRAKVYRSYEHPDAPFLSAKGVWERFAPSVNRECSALQSMSEANEDVFVHLSHLYYLQTALPAEWMRKILLMQEQQYKWLKPDGRLRQDDLALFGFHTVQDWFGKDFVDLMAQFIHNTAIEAEAKGYVVSLEEAKAELRKNYTESMKKIVEAKWPIQLSYKDQLRILGMDESEAARTWRKVMLFRRYFNDVGEAAFIDRLPYSEFAAVASEKASVESYQLSPSLKLTSALDLLAFETYIKSVAVPNPSDPLALPTAYVTPDEAAKKAPQLVATEYAAQVAVVDKRETSLNAPLKEVWDYETQEEVWKNLKKEFTFVQQLTGKTAEERFAALEMLDPVSRSKIDLFARKQLLIKHPEWIDAALLKAQPKETQLFLSAGSIEMPHIANPKRLGSLFEQILTKPEDALSELQHFDSGDAVFRFDNIAKVSDPKIKTFEQAKKDGSLNHLVENALQAAHSKYKAKLPAEKQTLEWTQVKEELAELLLAETKKLILKHAPKEEVHFASCRFLSPVNHALKAIQQGKEAPVKTIGDDPLIAQFKLERIEKEIPRTAEENWMAEESFILQPKSWSPVHVAADGTVQFIYVKERKMVQEPILEQLSFGKEMLVSDVQRVLAEKILTKMKSKQAIVIPVQPEQE